MRMETLTITDSFPHLPVTPIGRLPEQAQDATQSGADITRFEAHNVIPLCPLGQRAPLRLPHCLLAALCAPGMEVLHSRIHDLCLSPLGSALPFPPRRRLPSRRQRVWQAVLAAESKLESRSPLSSQGLWPTHGGVRVGNTPLIQTKCFGATAWPQRARTPRVRPELRQTPGPPRACRRYSGAGRQQLLKRSYRLLLHDGDGPEERKPSP
jgi:hypothetical protein